jgi:hypothetical protein
VTLNCQDTCPYVPGFVEDWEVEDPAGKSIEETRAIRDDVDRRVRALVARADEIRSDRSAHARRLVRILPTLVAEFEAVRPAEEIRACADAVLGDFDDAAVRSFVEPLALRKTRECLRDERCVLLA